MTRFLFGPKAWLIGVVFLAAALALLALLALRSSPRDPSHESPPVNPFVIDIAPGGALPRIEPRPESRDCAIQLHDVSSTTGITFTHHDGSSGRRYIIEAMSTGIATFDYDGDGPIDIYFPNGAPLPGCEPEEVPRHALYRNLGDWKFQDVTRQAGLLCTAYGMGVTVGDFDDDGLSMPIRQAVELLR